MCSSVPWGNLKEGCQSWDVGVDWVTQQYPLFSVGNLLCPLGVTACVEAHMFYHVLSGQASWSQGDVAVDLAQPPSV